MKAFAAVYGATERLFFFSLTRKLVGNVGLLALFPLAMAALVWAQRNQLAGSIAGAGLAPDAAARLLGTLDQQLGIIFVLGAAGLAAAIGVTLYLRHLIVRPVRSLARLMREISDGDADLARDMPAVTQDELRELAEGYNAFAARLREIIGEVRRMSVQVAYESAKTSSEVAESTRLAGRQGELSAEIFSATEGASRSLALIAQNAQHISGATEQQVGAANASYQELLAVSRDIDTMRERMVAFEATVGELGRNSHGIEKVVKLINDVSDQTNLLALNAAIEAARAGEAGRGFAVVADEVRKLAEKVKAATGEIAASIQSMSDLVGSTRSETEKIHHEIERSREVVEASSKRFEGMVRDFSAMSGRIDEVRTAIENVSVANTQIHEQVHHIKGLSGDVAARMEQSRQSSFDLSSATEKIEELAARFRIGRGRFEEVLLRAAAFRDRCRDRLEALQARGIDVFDRQYRPVPGTDPQKYRTCYDTHCETELQPLYDQLVAETEGATYALCIDTGAYAPTHNSKFSRPLTGNREADLMASRDKRIFSDVTGSRGAQNTARFLLQTYRRDTGEILNDLSMPIFIGGRHWGCLRLGFKPEVLLAD